jgi:GDPmannose 4,6-dehydratase
MGKSALIFGVTGQCGYYLTELLLSKGYKVTGVKRRTSGNNTDKLAPFMDNPLFRIIEGDVIDADSVTSCFENCGQVDEVYNMAAQSHVHTSFLQPSYTFLVNTVGTLNILQNIRRSPKTKMLQYSTSEMFGSNYDTSSRFRFSHKYQDENTRFEPMSPYAVSKVAAHELVKNYRVAYNLHVSNMIMFNTESPHRGENFVTKKITSWLGQVFRAHQQGLPYPVIELGNLNSYRDWSFCGDSQRAAFTILQQSQPDDFVVSTGETHTISEFLDMAISFAGVDKKKARNAVKIVDAMKRPSDVDYLCGDSSKLTRETGWRPTMKFADLVRLMVEYETITQTQNIGSNGGFHT